MSKEETKKKPGISYEAEEEAPKVYKFKIGNFMILILFLTQNLSLKKRYFISLLIFCKIGDLCRFI